MKILWRVILWEGSFVSERLRVSGIYCGNNSSFVESFSVSLVGKDIFGSGLTAQLFNLTYIQTLTGLDGTALYRDLETLACSYEWNIYDFKFGQYSTVNVI